MSTVFRWTSDAILRSPSMDLKFTDVPCTIEAVWAKFSRNCW